MKQFKDNSGMKWDIAVNVSTAKRVRDVLGVSPFDLFSPGTAEKVFGDPIMLVDLVYVLCQKQAEERGVTEEQFGEQMVGEALELAADAVMDAVADFFPKPRREMLNRQYATAKETADVMMQLADLTLKDQESQLVELKSSVSATNSPAA